MGVIKFFRDDSDMSCPRESFNTKRVKRINSTPNPNKFTINKMEIVNGYPILVVQYPNVLNYEGIKILMYGKNFNLELIKHKIDPHFFDEGNSPIARFIPTPEGIEMAITLAKNLP